jgi:hypothetical protein
MRFPKYLKSYEHADVYVIRPSFYNPRRESITKRKSGANFPPDTVYVQSLCGSGESPDFSHARRPSPRFGDEPVVFVFQQRLFDYLRWMRPRTSSHSFVGRDRTRMGEAIIGEFIRLDLLSIMRESDEDVDGATIEYLSSWLESHEANQDEI